MSGNGSGHRDFAYAYAYFAYAYFVYLVCFLLAVLVVMFVMLVLMRLLLVLSRCPAIDRTRHGVRFGLSQSAPCRTEPRASAVE
jgi:hypothetical protein